QPITVDYATADGTASTGDTPADYAATSGTLTFPANSEPAQAETVVVNGDTKFEADETFTVALSNPTNATLTTATGTGTITNDDAQPALSINNVTLAEGNSGTTSFVFTVSLSNASDQPITVQYATADGTASTGDTPPDYTGTSGTLTFP